MSSNTIIQMSVEFEYRPLFDFEPVDFALGLCQLHVDPVVALFEILRLRQQSQVLFPVLFI